MFTKTLAVCFYLFSPATFAVVDIVRDFRIISFRCSFLSCLFSATGMLKLPAIFQLNEFSRFYCLKFIHQIMTASLKVYLTRSWKEYSIHSNNFYWSHFLVYYSTLKGDQQFVTRHAVLFLFFFGLRTYNGVYFKP